MRRPSRRLRVEALEGRAVPTVLHVGPGEQYALPSQAAAAAQNGDDIQIDAGTYGNDTAVWSANNLTIEGVGGRAVLDDTGYAIPNRKGIFVLFGANTTVKNITFQGAHDAAGADRNWAGIRAQGSSLTVLDCGFLHNDDGILGGDGAASDVTVRRSEFGFNGWGDGFSHNLYIGHARSFTLTDSYTHDSVVGHLVKSRAATNTIAYDRILDNQGTGSYEVDLPNGGASYLVGNAIEQGPNSQNSTVITYAEEGATNPVQELYVINDTVVNDRSGGTFVHVAGTPTDARLENNIFAGPGTALSGTVTQNDHNLAATTAIFVNPAASDYHLNAGVPAIDAGVDPGTVNGVDLTPREEPTAPLVSTPRPVVGPLDLGAFEYPVPAAPAGLTAAAGDGRVSLTWAASAGATGYNVYRGTAAGGEALLQSGVTATAFTDSGLTNGTTYYYQVTAVDAAGEGARSAEASATPHAAPRVAGVAVNNGAAQRSMVTTLTVSFDTAVTLLPGAFALTRVGLPNGGSGDNATVGTITVNTQVVGGATVATLTFSGSNTTAGSLNDGNWTLTVDHSKVVSAVGSVPMAADFTQTNIRRLYGDGNGDGRVDNADFFLLRSTFGLSSGQSGFLAAFDYDGSGLIDNADFFQFRARFGWTV
jgi:hypothetical protein